MKNSILTLIMLFHCGLMAEVRTSYVFKATYDGKQRILSENVDSHNQSRALGYVQSNIGSAGIDINQSGSYILGHDVSSSAASGAIRITASNVTLDLNGFTVTNDAGLGISLTGTDVTIKNGYITNCSGTGLSVVSSGRVHILDIQSNMNNVGIAGSNSSDLVIKNCSCIENTLSGVNLSSCDRFRVEDMESSQNGNHGITLSSCSDLILWHCLLASNNTVVGDFHALNGDTLNRAVINHVQAANTSGTGTPADSGAGMNFSGAATTSLSIEECEIMDNAGRGIQVNGVDTNNRIEYLLVKNCSIHNNGATGFIATYTNDITVRDCQFVNNAMNGIRINDGDTTSNTQNISLYNNDVIDNSGDGIDCSGVSHCVAKVNRVVRSGIDGFRIDGAAATVTFLGVSNQSIAAVDDGFMGPGDNSAILLNSMTDRNGGTNYASFGALTVTEISPVLAQPWENLSL